MRYKLCILTLYVTVLSSSCVHQSSATQEKDPFEWMETDKEKLKGWLEKQQSETDGYLSRASGRDEIARIVRDRFQSDVAISELKSRGSRWFFKIVGPGAESPSYAIADSDGTSYSVIVDAKSLLSDNSSILWAEPNLTGDKIFFGLSRNSDEVGIGKIFDAKTKVFAQDSIQGMSSSTTIAFLPHNKSLIYSSKFCHAGTCSKSKGRHAYLHVIGQPQTSDIQLFGPGLEQSPSVSSDEIVGAFVLEKSSHVIAWTFSRKTSSYTFYSKRVPDLTNPSINWQKLDHGPFKISHFEPNESSILLGLVDDKGGAKIGRLKEGRNQFDFAILFSHEDGYSLGGLQPAGDHVVTVGYLGMTSKIKIYDSKTKEIRTLSAPPGVNYASSARGRSSQEVIIEEQSFNQPTRFMKLSLPPGELKPAFHMSGPQNPQSVAIQNEVAISRDGTKVPMTIIYKESVSKPRPTLLSVYGAYGLSKRPKWDPKTASWLDVGGAEVNCHVRGGGELGDTWHEAGKRRKKINGIQDTIACAERLFQMGFTSSEQLAILSGSAGGVITNYLAVTKPHLFKAVVTRVGLAHLTRFHLMPSGPASIPEFGDFNDPDDRSAMEKIDPYLLVKPGQQVPSMLLTVGWNDSRVMPWQPSKFAAKIKSTPQAQPVLLRTDFKGGHGLVAFTKTQQQDEWTDIVTFLAKELKFGPGYNN